MSSDMPVTSRWISCLIVLIASFSLGKVTTQNSSANKNTLVLLDNLAIKETHSMFFRKLQGNHTTSKRFIGENVHLFINLICFIMHG